MKRFALVSLLFVTALGANAALVLRPMRLPEPVGGDAAVTLGGVPLNVPRVLIRDHAQRAGGRLDRLDLAVNAADFAPLPASDGARPQGPSPNRLSIILSPAGTEPDMPDLFQTVYARFLARETWSNPGGLAMRRFRAGTPYEDRELYIGAGGKRIFVALCPVDREHEVEPCLARLRQDGIEAELRFGAHQLPDWRRISTETLALLARLRPEPAMPSAP